MTWKESMIGKWLTEKYDTEGNFEKQKIAMGWKKFIVKWATA